jgi:hypothetical protein
MKPGANPDEVFVIIRIYDVRTEPDLILLVDPWQMHIDGLLCLKSESAYSASFAELPPILQLKRPIETFTPPQSTEISPAVSINLAPSSESLLPILLAQGGDRTPETTSVGAGTSGKLGFGRKMGKVFSSKKRLQHGSIDVKGNQPTNKENETKSAVSQHLQVGQNAHPRHRRAASRQHNVQYSYKPLNLGHIRLVRLLPGIGEVPLEGEISHTTLEAAGQYSAISYVWGPALRPYHLKTSNGEIPLTRSAYSALCRLRDRSISITLWIDALCIDQTNDFEKTIQIRMMGDIFQSAEQVFAYIGDETDIDGRAVEALMQMRMRYVNPDSWPKNLPPIPSTWCDDAPSKTDNVWGDLYSFFQRDWFQRAWVVQELILASKVKIVCGTWEVNWEDIFATLEACLKKSDQAKRSNPQLGRLAEQTKAAFVLGTMRRTFKEKKMSQQFNLLTLIEIFNHTDATKDRDRLFALLGLATDVKDELFDPDYDSSLEAVVRRYASEFVRRGSTLDLLYKAGASKSYDFCSWIPNWTGRRPRKTISNWRGARGVFSAGGSLNTQPQNLRHGVSLELYALPVDKITDICVTTMKEHDIISVVNIIHGLMDNIKGYPTGESIAELKIKIPIGDAMNPSFDDTVLSHHQGDQPIETHEPFKWHEEFFPIASVQEMVEFLKKPQQSRKDSWKYWTTASAFAQRLHNARFCITSKGYLGLAPHEAKVGDEIFVFYGGAVPFVLRPVSKEESTYTLIGESYIHGIMYGEVLSMSGVSKTKILLK